MRHGRRRFAGFMGLLLVSVTAWPNSGSYDQERGRLLEQEEALFRNIDRLSEAERLDRLIQLYFEYALLEYPAFATQVGYPKGQDRWTARSLAAIDRRAEDSRRSLQVIGSIDGDRLSDEYRLNYDLMLKNARDDVEQLKFPTRYLAINQLSGVQQSVPRLLAMMPTDRVEDYENILARLRAVSTLVDQNIVLLSKGIEAGLTPPAVTLRDVPQQVNNLIPEDPLASPLLRAFQEFPEDIAAADEERLRAQAVRAYEQSAQPAYRRLYRFLTEEYLPGARETIAIEDLPDGEAWYAFNVRRLTTTDLSPREIHEIGLSEVQRIRDEMDLVIEASGFEGSFEEFTEFLRTDPRFYYESAEELLRAYRDISKRADAGTASLFRRLPRLPYGVIPIPSYAAKSQTTAYYQRGSLEAGRPGYFFANTYALDTRPKWEMEALTLHEAVPGHHLQISIQQELDGLPWFRKYGGFTAFVEGWGLYSESLGEEMGFYEDPYSKFGQLTYEMWRAVRLVVDTGMHHLGWTRQQAIDFFVANSSKTEHDIVVEIDRYIVWPGQALAYKIGELKIKELRARAERELGEHFDIRAFHDAVLGDGAIPIDLLESKIDAWIEEQRE